MTSITLDIWGREFNLEIVYDYVDELEEILPIQKEAASKFVEKKEMINESLQAVKQYCIKRDEDKFEDNKIDNIFKYVIPTKLYVIRNDKDRCVAIMCDYRYDLEHGIAVVYKNEKFLKVDDQANII